MSQRRPSSARKPPTSNPSSYSIYARHESPHRIHPGSPLSAKSHRELRQESIILSERVEFLETELERTRSDSEHFKSMLLNQDELRRTAESKSEMFERAKERLQETTVMLENANELNSSLERDKRELLSDLQATLSQNRILETSLADYQAKFNAGEIWRQNLESRLEEERTRVDKQRSELSEKANEVIRMELLATEAINSVRLAESERVNELRDWEARAIELSKKLRETVEDLLTQRLRADEAERAARAMKEQSTEQESRNRYLEERVSSLQNQLSTVQAYANSLEAESGRKDERIQSLEDSERRWTLRSRASDDTHQQHLQELKTKDDEIVSLREKHRSLMTLNDSLKHAKERTEEDLEMTKRRKDISQVQSELNRALDEIVRLEDQLNISRASDKDSQSMIENLKVESKQNREEIKILKQQNRTLHQQVEETKSKLLSESAAVARTKAKLEEREKEVRDHEINEARLNSRLQQVASTANAEILGSSRYRDEPERSYGHHSPNPTKLRYSELEQQPYTTSSAFRSFSSNLLSSSK